MIFLTPQQKIFAKYLIYQSAARQGVTSFTGANDIQYAFNFAGLGNTVGREAVIPVSKAAHLMRTDNETLANDVAGAVNNFYKDKTDMNDTKAVKNATQALRAMEC
ncbi:hypothetical protein PsalN5692_03601 (plasmid) [Piscirickettsia salmonis]|nr:hypothetical protein PsalN5692_03601 [Piscirickettsia salmonis]